MKYVYPISAITRYSPASEITWKGNAMFNIANAREHSLKSFAALLRDLPMETKERDDLRQCAVTVGTTAKRAIEVIEIMRKALQGVIHHNNGLKEQFKISPALIRHVEAALAEVS